MAYVGAGQVTEGAVTFDDVSSEIVPMIEYVRDFSDEMRELLIEKIEDLEAIVGDYDYTPIAILFDIGDISKPVYPSDIVPSTYVSDIYDTLLTKIKNDIITGGNGLTDAVYSAIIQREQEARRANQDTEYRRALDAAGTSGFNLPSGHVAAIQTALANEILSKDQDSVNNTLIKDYETATENTRFAVEMGVELEKLTLAAWTSTEERKLAVYEAKTQAISSEYSSLMEWVSAQVEVIKTEAEVAIKNAELDLDAYNSMAELTTSVAESIATIASQSVASALQAINTSMSYGSSESRGETWSHGESLGETHNYSEGSSS